MSAPGAVHDGEQANPKLSLVLATAGFLAVSLVLDALAPSLRAGRRELLAALLPLLVPILMGLLGLMLDSRRLCPTFGRAALLASLLAPLLGAFAGLSIGVLFPEPQLLLRTVVAASNRGAGAFEGALVGTAFVPFVLLVWRSTRAAVRSTNELDLERHQRAAWSHVALALCLPQLLIAARTQPLGPRTDVSCAIGLLAALFLVWNYFSGHLELYALRRAVHLGLEEDSDHETKRKQGRVSQMNAEVFRRGGAGLVGALAVAFAHVFGPSACRLID